MRIYPANILLPDFKSVDGSRWACVACDQYTSEPEYWERVINTVGDSPSTLSLMLPEIYLEDSGERVPMIHKTMKEYLETGILCEHPASGVYIERVQSDGKVRRGIVCAICLDDYDYSPDSTSAVRATEKTVVERIPPRLAVRRGAPIEMPHVMLLADDREDEIFSIFADREKNLYSFELMEGGGSISAALIDGNDIEKINAIIDSLESAKKTGGTLSPITLAVGDGNHSLATAKAAWVELSATLTDEERETHPARFALVEIDNLHDDCFEFEPIYRIVEAPDVKKLAEDFAAFAESVSGEGSEQSFTVILEGESRQIKISAPEYALPVATLQVFLDEWIKGRDDVLVDYIHGVDSLEKLASRKNCIGFLFDGINKNELFSAVEADGALPRKTFSLGHAEDKRYYVECRKIL